MRVKVVKSGLRWNGEAFSGDPVPAGTILDIPEAEVRGMQANSAYADHFEILRGRKPKGQPDETS